MSKAHIRKYLKGLPHSVGARSPCLPAGRLALYGIIMKQSYKKAGVNIDEGNLFVRKIKPLVKSTKTPGCVGSIGGFSGFFKAPLSSYKNPLLVASTDGVGTKLTIAKWAEKHDTIGIDLVAMCVNDLVACGAKPLFFLDYYATGKLSTRTALSVMKGIAKGCRLAGSALIGGETAELPGMYRPGDYDLAGFSVGIVDKKNIIDGKKIKTGDVILGLASSGIHSNGYSLVRKVFSRKLLATKLAGEVLRPTTIYVKPVLEAVKRFGVKGIANITGGGFYENIVRILPKGKKAVIQKGAWQVLPIFELIQKSGNVSEREMFRTFNMGIGMALVLPGRDAQKAKRFFSKKYKLKSWVIGEIKSGRREVEVV